MLFWNNFRLNLDLRVEKKRETKQRGCNLAGAGNVKSFVQSHRRLYDEEQTQLKAYRKDISKVIMTTGRDELAKSVYLNAKCYPVLFIGVCVCVRQRVKER